MQGGITTETLVHGAQAAPLFNEESTLGFDRFRVSWRDALNDQPFVDYVRSKLPASLDDIPNFNRSLDFASEPTGFVNFNYDAVTGLGLAMCRAGENETFFGGDDIYAHFRQLDFEGASGNVRISPETGTRNYTTIAFALWNIRIPDAANADGYSRVEFVPSVQFRNDAWSAITGNEFVFADGSTVAPLSLPPVPFNFNYIGSTSRAVGYTLMSLVLSAVLASIGWTIYHKDHVVVDSAQPVFLIVVSVGAFTMALAIIPLAFEETVSSNELILNTACMAVPWLYFIGTSVALSALLVKTEAVHKVPN
jgi:7 transmembrane sweet-taste receptor of 3 GCPR